MASPDVHSLQAENSAPAPKFGSFAENAEFTETSQSVLGDLLGCERFDFRDQ